MKGTGYNQVTIFCNSARSVALRTLTLSKTTKGLCNVTVGVQRMGRNHTPVDGGHGPVVWELSEPRVVFGIPSLTHRDGAEHDIPSLLRQHLSAPNPGRSFADRTCFFRIDVRVDSKTIVNVNREDKSVISLKDEQR